mgnify:CR=1 FL=1
MHLKIYHRTEYHYEQSVHHSIQELRLIPNSSNAQEVLKWKIYAPSTLNASIDAFENQCHTFVMESNYSDMIIEAEGEIKTTGSNEFVDAQNAVSPYYLLQQTDLTLPSNQMVDFFKKDLPKDNSMESLLALSGVIREKIEYKPGATTFATPAQKSFELGAGVCQDYAHIMIGLCRHANIPARYVSGYLHVPELPNLASHAWVDVCLDISKGKWVSIDVTHFSTTDEKHVRLATGRDYASAAPIKGFRSGGGAEELQTRIMIQEVK